jgi:hypothetical protein
VSNPLIESVLTKDRRLFDERSSLEPRYPSIVASKAEEHYDQLDPSYAVGADSEIERLVHAPPG